MNPTTDDVYVIAAMHDVRGGVVVIEGVDLSWNAPAPLPPPANHTVITGNHWHSLSNGGVGGGGARIGWTWREMDGPF
jgi:hypothetical protein